MAILELFPTQASWSQYLITNQASPQVFVDKLKDLKPNTTRKFGPQLSIQLFNAFHDSKWQIKNKKVIEGIENINAVEEKDEEFELVN